MMSCSPDNKKNASEWISVEDRLPEIADMVIVCTQNGIIDTAWRTGFSIPSGQWDTYSGRFVKGDKITHWTFLPEPPKETDHGT